MNRSAGGTVDSPTIERWNETWALAVAFGVAAVPWTYAFVAGLRLPLWPSFVASASFFAAGGGLDGLVRSYAGNLAGIAYAVATLVVVAAVGGGPLALALVVGAFMLLASLHAFLPRLDYAPAVFFGYATLFGVNAAGATVLGHAGLGAEAAAAVVSMLLGAAIGLGTQAASRRLS